MSAGAVATVDVTTRASSGAPGCAAAPRRSRRALPPAIVALLALVPLIAPPETCNTLTRLLALAVFAVSLDLLVGVAGMASLGHAAPFGAGAYAAGLVAKDVSPFFLLPVAAGLVTGAVVAAAVGWLVVRCRGTYLLMLTLAVAELLHVLAGRLDVLGSSNGLAGIPAWTLLPGGEPVRVAGIRYWAVLSLAVLLFAALWGISRSPLGRALRGLRDNEARMAAIGYSVFRLKYLVFVVTGAAAGAAGALWVAQTRFVAPTELGFELSALALLAVVVGGRGTLWGPALGAALVFYVRDDLGPQLGGRSGLVLGLVFVASVYLLPRGLAGTVRRRIV